MASRPASSLRQERTKVRCAIYTGKSSEEGLEQDFNSLHAQREACEAYITSQRHEGWKLLPTRYDDGGYSGGSMERPGLQKLLADIQSGLVDVVVVYKVDRLTRSLTDFARIVETLDAQNASFVSVTQSFNTTTSMGRLTLNVLLSFAQFEREVTSERIHDKIAASKKKGMWMGGFVPMGYAASGRSLQIVEDEATIIRRIFDRFLALESVRHLKAELDKQRINTREFVSATNRSWGNRPFCIGHLRSILQNPIYVGEVRHRDEQYPAQHKAIIGREQFDQVQTLIASRALTHRMRAGAEHINLLTGLIVDEASNRFTSAHSSKKGIRYRYYVSSDPSSPLRIPAGEIETLVIESLVARLNDRHWLRANILPADASPDQIANVEGAAIQMADRIGDALPTLAHQALAELVSAIKVLPGTIRIHIEAFRLTAADPSRRDDDDHHTLECVIEVANPSTRPDRQQHLIVAVDATREPTTSKWLVKAIARGATWYDDLINGRAATFRDIAEREGVDERYVAQLIPMAFLEPRLLNDCVEGRRAAVPYSGKRRTGHRAARTLGRPVRLTQHPPSISDADRIENRISERPPRE